MRSLGIDLSEWDLRPLDWQKARELLSFCFIKISQSINPDPLFRAQWEAAEGYVLRGLYHFFDPAVDPKRSVDKTLELYSQVTPGELPPALDLEITSGRSDTLDRARSWLEIYEHTTGVRPIVYTSPGFLRTIGAQERTASGRYIHEWLKSYEVWLASWPYDNESDALRAQRIAAVLNGSIYIVHPNAVPPWTLRPTFHQWTSRGEPASIPGYYMGAGHKLAVDLNYFFGTKEELFLRFGEPRKRPAPGVPMAYKYSITPKTADGLRVRLDHYVTATNRIGSLSVGKFAFGNDKWVSDDNRDEWVRVVEVDGALMDGWIAAKHEGVQVGVITENTTGETPTDPPQAEAEINLHISINSSAPGGDLTGEIEVSSPGYVSQTLPLRLPPS